MTNLIRNCAHFSQHQTLIDPGSNTESPRTIKTTFSSNGVKGIEAEYNGLVWFASKTNRDQNAVVKSFRSMDGFARIETYYIDGSVAHMPADPSGLINKTRSAITFYLNNLWSGTDTPSHGDYSLSNHVFDPTGNVTTIIDWEHFNRLLPPQYDPLYMIVEPFLFWRVNNKNASADSISAAKKLIATLQNDIALPNDAVRAPASWLRQIAGQNTDAWGEQAHKVPFLNAHEQHIAIIDELLSNT